MFFASDNGGPVHPEIMASVIRANEGHAMPYGACDWTARAESLVRDTFAAPDARVFLVPTGTSANAICLSSLTSPWQRIFCSDIAHIYRDEMGAVPFYANGADMAIVPQSDGRMSAADLAATIDAEDETVRRGPVSVTQVTEAGTVYGLSDLAALGAVARDRGLPLHMDGARFANAVAALGTSAAEMSAGVAAVSFGGTKNGCMGVEAAVLLDPALGETLPLRRQRGGHLFSKSRFLAAQMVGYLENGLWLDMAAQANAKAARLAEELLRHPDVQITSTVQANIIFARWPRALHDRLKAEGSVYYLRDDPANAPPDRLLGCRLVCDWSIDDEEIARFVEILRKG